jgi:hypothetical protein
VDNPAASATCLMVARLRGCGMQTGYLARVFLARIVAGLTHTSVKRFTESLH